MVKRQILFFIPFLILFSDCSNKIYTSPNQVEDFVMTSMRPVKDTFMLDEPIMIEFNISVKEGKELYYYGNGREVYPQYFYVSLEAVHQQSGKKYKYKPGIGLGLGRVIYSPIPQNVGRTDFVCVNDFFSLDTIGTFKIDLKRYIVIAKNAEGASASRIVRNHSDEIVIIPKEYEKFGILLDTLSKQVDRGIYRAARSLSHIEDERVIPHYLSDWNTEQSCRIGYMLEEKISVLSKFDKNEEVYQFYKYAAKILPDAPCICATKRAEKSSACRVRGTAIRALAEQRHPEAFDYLASLRTDTLCVDEKYSYNTYDLLKSLYHLDARKSELILREYINDEDEKIRELVNTYLRKLEE
ncbi:MAG: hypothetical protein AAF849_24305 [Bacteroidota bacterium]